MRTGGGPSSCASSGAMGAPGIVIGAGGGSTPSCASVERAVVVRAVARAAVVKAVAERAVAERAVAERAGVRVVAVTVVVTSTRRPSP